MTDKNLTPTQSKLGLTRYHCASKFQCYLTKRWSLFLPDGETAARPFVEVSWLGHGEPDVSILTGRAISLE